MSRVGASSSYLKSSSPVVTGLPVTLACWFKAPGITTNYALMTLGGAASNERVALQAAGAIAADAIRARVADSAGLVTTANSLASFTANTWHHAAAVFASSTLRSAYIDGGNRGNNTTSRTAGSFDTIDLLFERASGTTQFNAVSVLIAEAAIWDVALSDDEVAMLGSGHSPLFVRPQSLKNYFPLFGRLGASAGEEDWLGGNTLVNNNSPAVSSDRPRIIYPRRAQQAFSAAVSAVPTLSDLRAVNITSSSVQGTYDYAF